VLKHGEYVIANYLEEKNYEKSAKAAAITFINIQK
jgi:hypothetical protein